MIKALFNLFCRKSASSDANEAAAAQAAQATMNARIQRIMARHMENDTALSLSQMS